MAKTGRPKKDSAKLPEWFDIKKYADVKNFSTHDWLHHIEFRKHLFFIYTEHMRDPEINLTDRNLTPMLLLLDDPIGRGKTLVKNLSSAEYAELVFRKRGVRDILNEEIMLLLRAFPKKIRDHLLRKKAEYFYSTGLWVQGKRDSRQRRLDVHKFSRLPSQSLDRLFLSIDMNYPNEVLLTEFAELLEEKRPSWGDVPAPFYGSRDFEDWYKCGVLPYLDLKLWALVACESFHWPTFTEHLKSLTGLRYGSENAHQKAVKACEKLLMDDRTIRVLHSQMAREKAGKIKKSKKLSLRNNSENPPTT